MSKVVVHDDLQTFLCIHKELKVWCTKAKSGILNQSVACLCFFLLSHEKTLQIVIIILIMQYTVTFIDNFDRCCAF